MNRSHEIFTETLLNWFDQHGRKHLPWQNPRTSYQVWLSEIMLQQTQVTTVIPYYLRFIEHFPNIDTLASATEDDVLALWSGLGYYSRGRNLHKTACIIHKQFNNVFPNDLKTLQTLPGVGPSTAAAIASLAFNQPTAILDGNVKRVLSRYFLVDGSPELAATQSRLWELANDCMDQVRCADYTQAIMDMGALCCKPKNPDCMHCPLKTTCQAHLTQQTESYPAKKRKTELPHKFQQFLVLHNEENAIYLEKRPPVGIWGGLWCLPSVDVEMDPMLYVRNRYFIAPEAARDLMQLKHTFSHFHLHIKALTLRSSRFDGLNEPKGQWFHLDEIAAIGIPRPVQRIIEAFYKSDLA